VNVEDRPTTPTVVERSVRVNVARPCQSLEVVGNRKREKGAGDIGIG
jgi:hypothetical protein